MFKQEVGYKAKQIWGPTPSKRPMMVRINYYWEDKRKRDVSNLHKLLLDSLSGVAWIDDQQVMDLHLTKTVGKGEKVRTVINVQEIR